MFPIQSRALIYIQFCAIIWRRKKNVTQNIKFVCRCVDNIFFPKFDIIRDKQGKFSFGVKVEHVTFKYTE